MVRHVKTPAGADLYHEPIGAVIVEKHHLVTPKLKKPKAPPPAYSKKELHGAQPTLVRLQNAPSGTHVSFERENGQQFTFSKNHAGNWVDTDKGHGGKEYTPEELDKYASASDVVMSMMHIKSKGPFDGSNDPIIAAKKVKATLVAKKAQPAFSVVDVNPEKQKREGKTAAQLVQAAQTAKLNTSTTAQPDLVPWTTHPDFKGSHELRYFEDKNTGKHYIAKSFDNDPKGLQRLKIEDAANGIGALYGFGTPKSYVMQTPDGKMSHVQEVIDNNGLDFRKVAENGGIAKLSTPVLKDLMTQQVLDWLVSNTDAHGDNFLRTTGGSNGSVVGIDKGQAWKNFPNDKLAADYQAIGGIKDKPLYNFFFDAVKNGQITDEQYAEIKDAVLAKAKEVSEAEGNAGLEKDDKVKDLLQQAFPGGENYAKRVAILHRKDDLLKDFTKLYDDNEPHKDEPKVVNVSDEKMAEVQAKMDAAVAAKKAAAAPSPYESKKIGDVMSHDNLIDAQPGTVVYAPTVKIQYEKQENGWWIPYPESAGGGSVSSGDLAGVNATLDSHAKDNSLFQKKQQAVAIAQKSNTLSNDDLFNAPVGTTVEAYNKNYIKQENGLWQVEGGIATATSTGLSTAEPKLVSKSTQKPDETAELKKTYSDAMTAYKKSAAKLELLKAKHSGKNPVDLSSDELKELTGAKIDHEINEKTANDAADKLNAINATKNAALHPNLDAVSAGKEKPIEQLQAEKNQAQADRKNANIAREHFLEDHPNRDAWTAADKAQYDTLSTASKQAQVKYLAAKSALMSAQTKQQAATGNGAAIALPTVFDDEYKQLDGSGWDLALPKPAAFKKNLPVIQDYTVGLAGQLNNALRADMEQGTDKASKFSSKMKALDDSLTPIKENTILYRGTHALNNLTTVEQLQSLIGQKVPLPAYTSTSHNAGTGKVKNSKVIIKFLVPADANVDAAYLEDVSSFGATEAEVLLQRGLMIVPVDVRARNAYPGDTTPIVTAIIQPVNKK